MKPTETLKFTIAKSGESKMLINITLLVYNPKLSRFLVGSMQRHGSVIRWAAGTANGGQIFRHLAETPGLTSKLMTVPFPHLGRN